MSPPEAEILSAIFPTLTPHARDGLRELSRLVDYPAETMVCQEGAVEYCLYIIVEGRVDVVKHLEGQRLYINHIGRGGYFGDISLLLEVPRTASIVTSMPTRVLEIDRRIFARLLATNPSVVVALTQLTLQRFLAQEEKQLLEIARLKRRDVPAPKVFLSYARADQAFVTRLANSLLRQQVDMWLDLYRLEPAQSWARQIGRALDLCELMVLVLSAASVASENVEDEWNYYLDQKKPVIVVRLEPCKMPYRLSKLHYIDFYGTDFERALAQLLATLNTS